MKNEMQKSSVSLVLREELDRKIEKLAILRRPPSIKDCVVAQIIKNYPEEMLDKVSNLVFKELEKTVRWFNLNDFKRPNTELMLMWSDSLVDQFELESPEDFVRFFNMIRKGNIELNFYERFGYDVIQKAFSKYLFDFKLPEREKNLKAEKLNHQKAIDRSEVVSGFAETLGIINKSILENSSKKVAKSESNSKYTKEMEIQDLKRQIDGYSEDVLKQLHKQYLSMSKIIDKKVILDEGCKIVESRLSLIGLKKMIDSKR